MSAEESKAPWTLTSDDEGDTVVLPDNVWFNHDHGSGGVSFGIGTKCSLAMTVDELRALYPFIRRLVAAGSMLRPENRHAAPYRVTDGVAGEYLVDAANDVIAYVDDERLDWTGWPVDPDEMAELLPFLQRFEKTGKMRPAEEVPS